MGHFGASRTSFRGLAKWFGYAREPWPVQRACGAGGNGTLFWVIYGRLFWVIIVGNWVINVGCLGYLC